MRATVPALQVFRAGRLRKVVDTAAKWRDVQGRGMHGEKRFCGHRASAVQERVITVGQRALNGRLSNTRM